MRGEEIPSFSSPAELPRGDRPLRRLANLKLIAIMSMNDYSLCTHYLPDASCCAKMAIMVIPAKFGGCNGPIFREKIAAASQNSPPLSHQSSSFT